VKRVSLLFVFILYSSALFAQARTHFRSHEVIQAQTNTSKMFIHYLQQNKTDSILTLIDSAYLAGHSEIKEKIIKAAKCISKHYINIVNSDIPVIYGSDANYFYISFYPDYKFQLSFLWDNKNPKIIKVGIWDKKQIKVNEKKNSEVPPPPPPGSPPPPLIKE
jgi:hypothetical protein